MENNHSSDSISKSSTSNSKNSTSNSSSSLLRDSTSYSNYGSIILDTKPKKSDVYINNESIGQTPIEITDVKSGYYLYTLVLEGYNNFSSRLIVHDNKITHISVDFDLNQETTEYLDIPLTKTQDDKTSEKEPIQIEEPDEMLESENNTEQNKHPVSEVTTENYILDEIQKTNQILSSINTKIEKTTPSDTIGTYDRVATITTAVISDPKDPTSSVYQRENINNILGNNADTIYVYNDGPGLLYAIVSTDGIHYTNETLVYEGEVKQYNDVYTIGLRSPTALLNYRVTERNIGSQSSERFSGSRFSDRRDRRGVVLFHDDYESSTLKFTTSFTGLGTIVRSTDTSYRDDFSLRFTTGAVANDISSALYHHSDFHKSKVGVQVRFASAGPFVVGLAIHHIIGTTSNEGNITITNTGSLDIQLSSGPLGFKNFPQTETGFQIRTVIQAFNTIKLVIDLSTLKYVNVTVNGITFDLNGNDLFVTTNTVTPPDPEFIINLLTLQCSGGCATTGYFDDYIFTEDEP